MIIENVPAELRALRQWVVWRALVVDDKVTKPLYDPNNPAHYASIDNPRTWGTFEDAHNIWTQHPDHFNGIGFVFTEDDPYFGVDIDDEAKVKPENLAQRQNLVKQIMANVKTYAELSPSGKGVHMIGRGKLPVAGKRSTAMQVEIYCSMRYFTVTGNVILGRSEITDEQEFLTAVFGALGPETEDQVGDTEVYRSLDHSDEEIIRLATNFNPSFAGRFNAHVGCEPGAWSDTFISIVGMLDRFSGSVEQIERIILNSPMVLISPPSAAGESRLEKARRNLQYVLAKVRGNNNDFLYFADHGRQIVENLERAKLEQAKKTAEALAKANEAIAGMSKGSKSVLDAFPQLTKDEHKLLTRPPGLVGEFVAATEKASFKPFLKFAIPAALSTLSGIVSRGYKLSGGSGLNVNFILAAPSNAGKTQTMRAWERFMADAAAQISNTTAGPSHTRIVNSSTSSIQAMLPDFMNMPSLVWYVEEAYSQLSSMSEGKSPTDAHLRDSFNQLYDCGVHGILFSGPRSIANKKAEIVPINNLNVSTFWTTTTNKFDIFNDDALDGFLSRVVVIRHHAPGGDPVQFPETQLPPHLRDVLVQRLALAKQLDEMYNANHFEAYKLLTVVSTEQVAELHWDFIRTVDAIANAAITGRLPPVYGAISRLPLTSMRIAAVMAVIENPFTPAVTLEQYKWAFGYLLQNLVALLTDVDYGDLGSNATDETTVVARVMKELLIGPYKKEGGVPKQVLRDRLKHVKPFSVMRENGPGRSKRVSDTITYMLAEGMLTETTIYLPGNVGRPPTLLSPVLTDPIWEH